MRATDTAVSLDASAADDARWMRRALREAQVGGESGEVPVGAVVVRRGEIIGVGRNSPIAQHDPTAHAEILALRAAAERLGNYRLDDCELYVTLEPCAMCSGAILHARLARVVYGAQDPKTGVAGSVLNLFDVPELNHQTVVQGGVLAEECAAPLKRFFKARRGNPDPLREDALRTPESRFAGWSEPTGGHHYIRDLPSLAGLRLHYLEAGAPQASQTWLCLHGARDWSWRYAQRLAALAAPDRRVIAPDLIGFGRSDKPKKEAVHSLAWHVAVLQELAERLDLRQVSLLAPRDMAPLARALLAAQPQRFVGLIADGEMVLPQEVLDAPYPDRGHAAGPRMLARLLAAAVA